MTKKTYVQPITCVVHLRQQYLLQANTVQTTSTSDDVKLRYEKSGGSAEDAW